jgi:integrase
MLSDTRARRISPKDKPLAAGGVAGLFLFPSSRVGQGKWILRFVSPVTGKRRDMGLGAYPGLGIAAARKAAIEAHELIAIGSDPIDVRRRAEEETRTHSAVPTFRETAERVHAAVKPGFRNAKHADQWINTLADYVFPAIGDRPVTELRARDFADALRLIWLTKPETASRVRQRCDAVMKWCAARDLVAASPLSAIDVLLPRQPGKRERVEHHPAVPWRRLPEVARTLFHEQPPTIGRLTLEFLVLTAMRSGEVRGMTWDEVDLESGTWTIPARRMKMKSIHRVPLSAQALAILRLQATQRGASPLVFPSRRNTPVSDMTLTKVLRDAEIPSDTPGRFATAHGFRSSFRDWASENNYPRDLAEKALAHTIGNATEAAYHRTDLFAARRPMMDDWAGFVSSQSR